MPNLPYVPRRAELAVHEALRDTRVITINGARQVGKSTLVRAVLREYPDAIERRLDVATERHAAHIDPTRFVHHSGLLAIDEVQRSPELILSIKAAVDKNPRPGQFLLTGSARLLGLRKLPDALVGRMETIELWPFSQGEIERRPERFIDGVFADDSTHSDKWAQSWIRDTHAGEESRDGYIDRCLRGGFPEALARSETRRAKFFDNYVDDLIDRDVTQLAEIERRTELRRLLRLLAGSMAQPLSVDRIAAEVGLPATTTERYISLLEEVFLLKRIDGWASAATGRTVRMRKVLFVDSGLAANLSGLTCSRLRRADSLVGPLLENFVLGELARQLTWSTTRASLFHFRTKDRVEVDAVLESSDGRIVAIEVKAAESVHTRDFSGIRHLAARLGDRLHLGMVLHAGTTTASFGERMVAAPVNLLWQ
ncbi:MAG: ATP-binding protein [Nocardioides sp.]